ncbi:MAG: serine hydroxymethyltransferase [Candidatus Altiarchaeales archaeon WOR_SM1_86-2]|nr:MAG: serine hydroxymethyltransferase [Candidatus Altiarchaeales archaeon WOR_SM1_86-2]
MKYYHKILDLIDQQEEWRGSCLNMIASENIVSGAVKKAISSDFGHRYAEGVLGGRDDGMQIFDRYYQGTRIFDKVEATAMKLTEDLFNAEHSNVVPVSGVVANLVAYYSLANHGDRITGLSIQDGGHISHTHVSAAGVIGLRDIPYAFDREGMNIDVDESIKIVRENKPKIMLFGASFFLFPHPVKEMRDAADEVGAYIMYDAAHVAGLIAGGKFQNPFKEGADVITSSTHKTFPGPQGGVVMCRNELSERIDNAAFPGLMSNHHLHHVAGFAVALAEMKEFGKEYADQIIKNSKALAEELHTLGFDVLCEHKGFTQSHQVIIDVSKTGRGKKIADNFEKANMIINKNLLPWDSLKDTANPSGIRIGTPEITRIGMKEEEMKEIAGFMKRIAIDNEPPEKVKDDVVELKKGFNRVFYCF